MMQENNISTTPNNDVSSKQKTNELDLLELVKVVWIEKKIIIKTTIVFMLFGLFIGIFSQKQYKATTVMIPQVMTGQNKLGGLSSFAAMAGINLDIGSDGNEISPLVYSQIIKSTTFQLGLMKTKFNFPSFKQEISLLDYFTNPEYKKFNLIRFLKDYTINLPGTIIKHFQTKKYNESKIKQSDSFINLSPDEIEVKNILNSSITLYTNQKEGTVTISTIMPDAKLAAQLGQHVLNSLQNKIIEFKIKKAKKQLKFIEKLHSEKKELFLQNQNKLATFRDQNKNISSARARTIETELQTKYQLSQSVLDEISKKLENAKIKVKEETPIFSVIEPVSIPTRKYKPKLSSLLIIWTFIGLSFSFGRIFIRIYSGIIKQKLKKRTESSIS